MASAASRQTFTLRPGVTPLRLLPVGGFGGRLANMTAPHPPPEISLIDIRELGPAEAKDFTPAAVRGM